MNNTIFYVALFFSTHCIHPSQLSSRPPQYELHYHKNNWDAQRVSLVEVEDPISSICFDQENKKFVAIGAGKRAFFLDRNTGAITRYECDHPIHSVSIDFEYDCFFALGTSPIPKTEKDKEDETGTYGHVMGWNISDGRPFSTVVGAISLPSKNLQQVGLSPVRQRILAIFGGDRTLFYHIAQNMIVDSESHPSKIEKNVKRVAKSCEWNVVGGDIKRRVFYDPEGTVSSHAMDDTYTSIHAKNGVFSHYVAVTKRLKQKGEEIEGERCILVAGEVASLVRSPVNPEMFMVVYKDKEQGIELQHVEGPSRYKRTHSNINGPCTFSSDGTDFVGCQDGNLVFLTIAQEESSPKKAAEAQVAKALAAAEAEVETIAEAAAETIAKAVAEAVAEAEKAERRKLLNHLKRQRKKRSKAIKKGSGVDGLGLE